MTKTKEKITGLQTIKMKNKQFINIFNPAFTAISNFPSNSKSGDLKYAIKRSLESIQQAGEAFTNERRLILEDASLKDENGNPKFSPKSEGGDYLFKSDTSRKLAIEQIQKLEEKEITLNVYPVRLKSITDCREISIGLEINLMGFIIENIEQDEKIAEEEKLEQKKV